MNAIVVFNEKAGTFVNAVDGLTPDSLHEALQRVGIKATLRPATGNKIESVLREAIAQQPDTLFVGGGDGTVSAAAALLADTPITLGVLPLGTLNHFSKDLGQPEKWRDAVAALASAQVRLVDLAEVNGRVFINNCSVGSYADAVRRRDRLREKKGIGKWLAMTFASFSVFRELRRLRLHVQTPSSTLNLRTPFLLVANNRYTGRVLDASLRPRLDEGQLWLYTTRVARRSALLKMMWQALLRRIDAPDDLEMHATPEATVAIAPGPVPVAADGEVLELTAPLKFRIRPKALRVLVPVRQTNA